MSLFIKCSYVKCKSHLPGIIIPIASFKALNAPPYMPRGHAIMQDLRLCESCALTAKIHELVDNKRWAEICRQIDAQGGTPPDRASLEMVLGSPKDKPVPHILRKAVAQMREEKPIE